MHHGPIKLAGRYTSAAFCSDPGTLPSQKQLPHVYAATIANYVVDKYSGMLGLDHIYSSKQLAVISLLAQLLDQAS